MTCSPKRLSLALLLLMFAIGATSSILSANPSGQSDNGASAVAIRKNKLFIRDSPGKIVHKKRFFRADECKINDGFLIYFNDGEVSAKVKDNALMGGRMTNDTMTFRLGNEKCQVIIQIRKYDHGG